jgi:tripartite-type tricarboxylate transporter receptor subunit TctC
MRFWKAGLVALGVAFVGDGFAQSYPSRPIHVINAFAAGSSIDVVTRVVLEEVQKRSGAVFVIEARPGALGAIGGEAVARAAPDGYMVMSSSSATHSSGPQLARVPYDVLRDFTQLGTTTRFDLMLVTRASNGPRNVAELIAEGRRRSLFYGYGSATGQVASSAVARAAGIQAEGASYRGQPLALNDLIGGHLDFVVSDVGSVQAQVRSGHLNALGVASRQRSALFPDVPTLTEAGLPVEIIGWVGIAGPARLPEEVRAWWARQLDEALATPAVAERLRSLSFETLTMNRNEIEGFVRQQYEVWGRHIRDAGITPQ